MFRRPVLQVPGLSRSGLLSRARLSAAVPSISDQGSPQPSRLFVTFLILLFYLLPPGPPEVAQHKSIPLREPWGTLLAGSALGKSGKNWLVWLEVPVATSAQPSSAHLPSLGPAFLPFCPPLLFPFPLLLWEFQVLDLEN